MSDHKKGEILVWVTKEFLKSQEARIEALEAALRQSDEAINQMIIWMPSGFAPQSQANAMRLAYEARKVARAALAEKDQTP